MRFSKSVIAPWDASKLRARARAGDDRDLHIIRREAHDYWSSARVQGWGWG